MGAPRLRPLAAGPVLDSQSIAELLGRPIDEVYAETRLGELPQPLNRYRKSFDGSRVERSPDVWRWSAARVLSHIDSTVRDLEGQAVGPS